MAFFLGGVRWGGLVDQPQKPEKRATQRWLVETMLLEDSVTTFAFATLELRLRCHARYGERKGVFDQERGRNFMKFSQQYTYPVASHMYSNIVH